MSLPLIFLAPLGRARLARLAAPREELSRVREDAGPAARVLKEAAKERS